MRYTAPIPAAIPYFGGKSKVAAYAWQAVGPNIPLVVDPFMGSAALILGRPLIDPVNHLEHLNDLSALAYNFIQAVKHDPEGVAFHADNPSFENRLHAVHWFLIQEDPKLREKLEADLDYYDIRLAGLWAWGCSVWIGSGFCTGRGPWEVVDGRLINTGKRGKEPGIQRPLPHHGDWGQGINRKGITRQLLDHSNTGRGLLADKRADVLNYLEELSSRFHSRVRVSCGDYKRVLTPSVLWGLQDRASIDCGVFLDPPYPHKGRSVGLYQTDHDVDPEVMAWALANASNPRLRIVYFTYLDDEKHKTFVDAGWKFLNWKAGGGYGLQGQGQGRENRTREMMYFSPHCLPVDPNKKKYTINDFPDLKKKEDLDGGLPW